MTGIDAVQAVMEEFAPDTPKRRTLQERRAMLAKGKRYACQQPKMCLSMQHCIQRLHQAYLLDTAC